MRRVSYHQSVFDLLGMRPAVSAEARAMIEACEARLGRRLPEAVRQWYLLDGVVPLRGWWRSEIGCLWRDFSNSDHPMPLERVLRDFAGEGRDDEILPSINNHVRLVVENQGCASWLLALAGGDDPPVCEVVSEEESGEPSDWPRAAETFSRFVLLWFGNWYTEVAVGNPYLNGLWLYAPAAEAVAPPYIDHLIDHFTDGPRVEIEPGVTQYHFHGPDGTVRVTTDDHREPGGVSAWWLHGASEDGLFRLTRRVSWCRGLLGSLRACTEKSRTILDLVRETQAG